MPEEVSSKVNNLEQNDTELENASQQEKVSDICDRFQGIVARLGSTSEKLNNFFFQLQKKKSRKKRKKKKTKVIKVSEAEYVVEAKYVVFSRGC